MFVVSGTEENGSPGFVVSVTETINILQSTFGRTSESLLTSNFFSTFASCTVSFLHVGAA